MKRLGSFLLTVATVLAMLSGVVVTATADESVVPTITSHADYELPSLKTGPYVIDTVSIDSNITSGMVGTDMTGAWVGRNGTMDWSSLPLNGFLNFSAVPSQQIVSTGENDRFRIVGEFAAPSTVSSFAMKTVRNNTRCSNVTVSFSVDGQVWVDVMTTTDNWTSSVDPVLTYTVPDVYNDTVYRYVKLEQKTDSSDYTALSGVVFFTETYSEAVRNIPNRTDYASYETPDDVCVIPTVIESANQTYGNIGTDCAGNWVGKDGEMDWSGLSLTGFHNWFVSQQIKSNSDNTNNLKIIGRFAVPTTVSAFAMRTVAATRFADVSISFSKDGQDWTEIAYITASSWSGADDSVVTYTVPGTYADVEYNYVKIEREGVPPTFTNVYTQIGGFVFYTQSGAMYTGTQSKINTENNSYSVRFVSTVDAAVIPNYEKVGYEISAVSGGEPIDTWERSTDTVYLSIIETVNGEANVVTAPDGTYFFALTVENIPMNYGEITFTVKPFLLLKDGETKMYAPEVVLVYNDGEMVVA